MENPPAPGFTRKTGPENIERDFGPACFTSRGLGAAAQGRLHLEKALGPAAVGPGTRRAHTRVVGIRRGNSRGGSG